MDNEDFFNDLEHNIKRIAPPLYFKSSKKVSHKTVLNGMSMLEGTQVGVELSEKYDQTKLIVFPHPEVSYNTTSTQCKHFLSTRAQQHVYPVTACSSIFPENVTFLFFMKKKPDSTTSPSTMFRVLKVFTS